MGNRWWNRFIVVLGVIALGGVTLGAVYKIHAANDTPAASTLTLNPDQFSGDVRKAYIVARDHPELLAQLHCYCGCEQQDGHKSLLDCYRTNHATSCDICVGEAISAGKLADAGMPVDQIREALHQRYDHGS
jgi:hypothetical protein